MYKIFAIAKLARKEVNLNIVFLSGQVVNDIDLKFIYNRGKKTLGRSNISVSVIELELKNRQVIILHAYDDIADFVYRRVKKEDIILIKGSIRDRFVKIEELFFF